MLLNARILWAQGKQEESRNAFMQLWAALPDGPSFDIATPKELGFVAHMMSNKSASAEQPAPSEQQLSHSLSAAVDVYTSVVAVPNKAGGRGESLSQDPSAHTGTDSDDVVRPESRQVEAALTEIARTVHRRFVEGESSDSPDRDARDTLRGAPDVDAQDARSPPGR